MTLLPGMESEARDHALSQWFTPSWLAADVWAWAREGGDHRSVLEPSAGDGALLRPLLGDPGECTRVLAVEVDHTHITALTGLRDRSGVHLQVMPGDFLAAPRELIGHFDLALLNPPYERGQTEAFISACLAVSDRAVVIAQGSVLHGMGRYASLWRHVDVTRGVWLSARPQFGTGASGSATAQRDFVVLELRRRAQPREPGEAMQCSWSWW